MNGRMPRSIGSQPFAMLASRAASTLITAKASPKNGAERRAEGRALHFPSSTRSVTISTGASVRAAALALSARLNSKSDTVYSAAARWGARMTRRYWI